MWESARVSAYFILIPLESVLKIAKNEFGFTGITKHAEKVKHYIPDAIIERPSVEDIMLANIKGGDNNVI